MEVENQEGQGPLWAVVPLMMMKFQNGFTSILFEASIILYFILDPQKFLFSLHLQFVRKRTGITGFLWPLCCKEGNKTC
jgi:hypothetical protein